MSWRTSRNAADSTGARLPTRETREDKLLVDAARDNDYATVAMLLKDGTASVEAGQASGYTALGLACNRGHIEVVRLLLDAKACPDTPICDNGATPLMVAVVWNRSEAVKLLLQHRAQLHCQGWAGTYKESTALGMARQHNRRVMIDLLVAERARRRLLHLGRLARLAGFFLRGLLDLYADVVERRYQPGGEGAVIASVEFASLSSRLEQDEQEQDEQPRL